MPKKEIGDLQPNYKEASKELKWGFRRLGEAEKFLTQGDIEKARKNSAKKI